MRGRTAAVFVLRCDVPITTPAVSVLRCELQEQVPQWISVSKRLPDVQVNVLLSRPPEHRQSRLRIMRLIDQGYEQYWADDIGDTSPINSYSHWMPLPEPPEVE
jgi:hypothetical protein